MKASIILSVDNITKKYNNELIFKNLSLKVKKGRVISIIGKSGCGKSTFLRCINRLENIEDGKIFFQDNNINEIPIIELRKKIGIVFQDYNLFENLTVLENLTICLTKVKQISHNESKKLAINILKKIDLLEKKDKYPDELSGGQKQRVAIARTMLMKPDIILLDEPTSALDKEMKESVFKMIDELKKENITLIIVSHEMDFVKNISDSIYVLKKDGLHRCNKKAFKQN